MALSFGLPQALNILLHRAGDGDSILTTAAVGGIATPPPLASSSGGRFIAKVADFGLSVKMDQAIGETHVVGMHQGTISHMAPEALTEGRQSKVGQTRPGAPSVA